MQPRWFTVRRLHEEGQQSGPSEGGDDTVGKPHRAQISQFELFELRFINSSFSRLSSYRNWANGSLSSDSRQQCLSQWHPPPSSTSQVRPLSFAACRASRPHPPIGAPSPARPLATRRRCSAGRRALRSARVRVQKGAGHQVRGNHLSDTTCLTHAFFKGGE